MNRDDDYTDLLGELSEPLPSLEKPDGIASPKGGICWINSTRMCGGDCVAHNVSGVEGSPDQCMVLALLGSMVDAREDSVDLLAKAASTMRVASEDAARSARAAAPVPSPFGENR